MKQDVHALIDFLSRSVSPYHGVAEVLRILGSEGFEELPLTGDWKLEPGGKYRVDCRGTMAVGFTIGEHFAAQDGFRIAASHMDWPCFFIKPDPEQVAAGCLKLSVEPYGGLIHSTWMDRPLSCAGIVTLRSGNVLEPERRLFDFGRPIMTIPNLAIHMNREANKGTVLDPAKDLLPVCATVEREFNKDGFFVRELAEELDVRPEDILSFDLVLYNAEAPALIGFEQDLLSAPRLDNLTSAFACLAGITGPQRSSGVNISAFFDNEEIGSQTKTGADSETLGFITEKIAYAMGLDRAGYLNALMSGFLLSCDVAHALHPNKAEAYDGRVCAFMNKGVTVKMNYSQKYATDAVSVSIVEGLCRAKEIPFQQFMNKAGSPGGGTLGKFTAANFSMRSVDIGVPILAMHSSRELMGVHDQQSMNDLVSAVFAEE